MSKQNAIQLSGVSKTFDGFKALTDADFTAKWGEVHALLGENGAGKSSLMNIVAGLYGPEGGSLFIDDNPIKLKGPKEAAKLGIGMVHQHFKLVMPFTVAENILLNLGHIQTSGLYRERLRRVSDDIRAMAKRIGFEIDPDTRVDQLSIAEQQRVEILKVLLAGAKVLILDEPTAVLTEEEAERLLTTVQGFAREGAAVILVTHKMNDVLRYADQVTIMRAGQTVKSLKPDSVSVDELIRLTVGESTSDQSATPEKRAPGAPYLQVKGLTSTGAPRALNHLDLTLNKGEIYGLAGVGGNGQSELANALMGIPEPVEGQMEIAGEGDLAGFDAARRRAIGIASIPADRYGAALAGPLSIADNFALGDIHSGRYGPFWYLKTRAIEADAAEAVRQFDVQGVRSLKQKAALLSGGNAQKLVIAREFNHPPKLVLAHSPSRGLDVKATEAVRDRLRAARDDGAAVLLISEDLDEVMAMADRIGVMSAGRIVAEFSQPADRQAIGQAMVNHV
ncbi:ABC transporter ATP-binding protein [Marinobacter sp. 2_MG-2023]|uniref:ABC transporter ATP-binding protein n=1 Tax=Marinobacter sp. 2_MG-2023 TaxID=3062679 RepID=UPI0026E4807D|nr:ABC transporter ATP-binding protein [Marinobacter sp. 2_MG-2023]MDO6443123.1 ABC transporter ATP-binding protein [Marinobacter sp. 2_MG-2023]